MEEVGEVEALGDQVLDFAKKPSTASLWPRFLFLWHRQRLRSDGIRSAEVHTGPAQVPRKEGLQPCSIPGQPRSHSLT